MALMLAAGRRQLGQVVAQIIDVASIHARMCEGQGHGWLVRRMAGAVLYSALRRGEWGRG